MKPHKHAEFIKAWADGAEIECSSAGKIWTFLHSPLWEDDLQYRIKPPMPKWPETTMTSNEAYELLKKCADKVGGIKFGHAPDLVLFANEAIKRAIQDGQVVLPKADSLGDMP